MKYKQKGQNNGKKGGKKVRITEDGKLSFSEGGRKIWLRSDIYRRPLRLLSALLKEKELEWWKPVLFDKIKKLAKHVDKTAAHMTKKFSVGDELLPAVEKKTEGGTSRRNSHEKIEYLSSQHNLIYFIFLTTGRYLD